MCPSVEARKQLLERFLFLSICDFAARYHFMIRNFGSHPWHHLLSCGHTCPSTHAHHSQPIAVCRKHDVQIVCIKTVPHTITRQSPLRSCPLSFVSSFSQKHECRSDAHMSSSEEILAPRMEGEDVVVWRRKCRTTLRTGGRCVLVAVVADPQSPLQSWRAS